MQIFYIVELSLIVAALELNLYFNLKTPGYSEIIC